MDTNQPGRQHAAPQQAVPRNTVGIRELKQNPSEIIARAANGERFDVLSNGKAVGVVIQRDAAVRSRLVSSDALTAMSRLAGARSRDRTGWARDLQAERELANDPIVDPWDTATQSAATPRTTTPDAAEA